MWENMNISKLRVPGIFLLEAEIHADPNIWEKWISIIRKSTGKHKHFKFMGFLKIFDEAEIHTIPKTWEKWILIIREKHGKKTNISKFVKYFGWSRNPYNYQNMGKVNSHSKGKIWENKNISKLSVSKIFRLMQKSMQFPIRGKSGFPLYGKCMEKHKHFKFVGFLNILDEAEIHTIARTWEKWISIIREKYGEKQTFQSNGFLKYFGWSRNPYNSQNMGKVNLHSTGKVRENTEISHSFRYLADLELMRTHGIPNVCECTNSHKMKIFCGKPYHSQAVGFWGN